MTLEIQNQGQCCPDKQCTFIKHTLFSPLLPNETLLLLRILRKFFQKCVQCVNRRSQPHFEELDSNTGEHELQQGRDNHDVSDGPDGHKHTLDHMLRDKNKQSQGVFLK